MKVENSAYKICKVCIENHSDKIGPLRSLLLISDTMSRVQKNSAITPALLVTQVRSVARLCLMKIFDVSTAIIIWVSTGRPRLYIDYIVTKDALYTIDSHN